MASLILENCRGSMVFPQMRHFRVETHCVTSAQDVVISPRSQGDFSIKNKGGFFAGVTRWLLATAPAWSQDNHHCLEM